MNWKWILVLILFILLVIFTVQNYKVVEIHFLFFTIEISRALVLFITLCIGILIGWVTLLLQREKKEKCQPPEKQSAKKKRAAGNLPR
jgi:uncharacterized integral membrane protein